MQEDFSILLAGQKLWLTPSTPKDKAFILSTWVRSYLPIVRKSETLYKQHVLKVKEDVYLKHHPRIAESLWECAAVLRDEADGSAILGYIVGDAGSGILDYVYVIPDLRNMGLARAMITALCGHEPTLTHLWPHGWHSGWKYNPYLAQRNVNGQA